MNLFDHNKHCSLVFFRHLVLNVSLKEKKKKNKSLYLKGWNGYLIFYHCFFVSPAYIISCNAQGLFTAGLPYLLRVKEHLSGSER